MKRFLQLINRIINNPLYIIFYLKRYISIVKIYILYLLILPYKNTLYKKNIWLVSEKESEARDNGYFFYKYVKETHPEINIFYVITKNSADFKKVKDYGSTLIFNSLKHFIYYLSAKVSISSQPFGAVPEPTYVLFCKSKNLHRKDQVVIHLKHGVTKDELSHILDYDITQFDLLCCVSERERKFMQIIHGYPDDTIKAIGFCRFDNLLKNHISKKQILIMPTHRMWLDAIDAKVNATESEKKSFQSSVFFKVYADLLGNEILLSLLRIKGYTIVFYPHYAIQSFISCFEKNANDVVIIASRENYDVQQLLIESKILITDYSSVFFDFAYMGKPVIYYQFDEEQYRSKHYKKGYFDYHNDGFGPVFYNKEDVIEEVKNLIDHDCIMSSIYKKRVNEFFTIRDTNNCKRTFEEIYKKANTKQTKR